MGFRYKNTNVTLSNYLQIYGKCTPDVLDEIRSAVLDDTEIADFIGMCGSDSYKLGQIRMAIREMLPIEYIDVKFTGRTIYLIRQGFKQGIDFSSILRYKKTLLSPKTIEKLAEFIILGVDIRTIDFEDVETDKVDIILKGLYKHYPMWLIAYTRGLSDKYIQALMRGMQLGVDIHPFVAEDWDITVLYTLFSYANIVDINRVLSLISSKFDNNQVKEIITALKEDITLPIETVCVKDEDGYPVYNSYQMHELIKAIKDGTITHDMYNANLSDIEMKNIRENNEKSK